MTKGWQRDVKRIAEGQICYSAILSHPFAIRLVSVSWPFVIPTFSPIRSGFSTLENYNYTLLYYLCIVWLISKMLCRAATAANDDEADYLPSLTSKETNFWLVYQNLTIDRRQRHLDDDNHDDSVADQLRPSAYQSCDITTSSTTVWTIHYQMTGISDRI